MRDYRIYWLDGEGHVEQAEWIQAEDDEAAIACVRELKRPADWELWHGRVRIAAAKPDA